MGLTDSWIAPQMEKLKLRHGELTRRLSEREVVNDRQLFPQLSREYAEIDPLVAAYKRCIDIDAEVQEAEELLTADDEELCQLAKATIEELLASLDQEIRKLELMLVPADPVDMKCAYLELRAGTGGDEAALFAADLLEMYLKYAAIREWEYEIINSRPTEHKGFKEVVCRFDGSGVYERLKFESGAHRVQRVPKTESQGRIHTSACTVAVLPEADPVEQTEIDPKDLRVDTFKSSGKGGQHVNKTDSAVRLTHIPSGVVVECQQERSQHLNKDRAFGLLQAKLLNMAIAKQESEETALRRSLVGSGDRSERIRTYNFPQGRVTDHRVNVTLYKLDEILAGALDLLVNPLLQQEQANRLNNLRTQGSHAATA